MASETPADRMPLHELLLHLLEHTDEGVITELWPDNELTLDDIAGLILARNARELTARQVKYAREMPDPHGPYRTPIRMAALLAHVALTEAPNGLD
jgi:hypothetical protein